MNPFSFTAGVGEEKKYGERRHVHTKTQSSVPLCQGCRTLWPKISPQGSKLPRQSLCTLPSKVFQCLEQDTDRHARTGTISSAFLWGLTAQGAATEQEQRGRELNVGGPSGLAVLPP